jgi:hypothetical protein
MSGLEEASITAALDAIPGGDPEVAHSMADKILLSAVPADIREAYQRVVERADWWACA